MTTRISSGGPSNFVASVPTASRTTATPTRPFQQVIASGSAAIVASAEQAATRLPGGAIVAAAVRPAPMGRASAASSPEGPTSALSGAAGSNGSAQPPGSIEGVLSQGADQNLYFLELQERISQESRTYSALSNVLKARHETVKNAIGNIR